MLPKISKYEFLAEPFHCDFSKRLLISRLGNILLNSADFHSNDRDFGMDYLGPRNKTWVLSRLAIDIKEMPKAYDKFSIETWVESAMRYFTNRNFAISNAAGDICGYGKSIWALIDTNNRQPQNILDIRDGDIANYIETEKECGIEKLSRVNISNEAKKVQEIDTHYSDVDINGHINSIKYIEHTLDLFPIDFYKTHFIKHLDIAYVAESYFGDILSFYKETSENGDIMISIRKKNNETTEEVEVVRCKLSFANISH